MEKRDYMNLKDRLIKTFQKVEVPVWKLTELVARMQGDMETTSTYAYEKMKLCNCMDKEMSEQQRVTYFIQGLQRDIQTFVTLKEPKTIEAALLLAWKKEKIIGENIQIDEKIQMVKENDNQQILEKLDHIQKDMKEEIAGLWNKIRRIEQPNYHRQVVVLPQMGKMSVIIAGGSDIMLVTVRKYWNWTEKGKMKT
jgi:hypothetical protein